MMASVLCRYTQSIPRRVYYRSLYSLFYSSSYRSQVLSCHYSSSVESLPRVAQPALWHAIIPKFIRRSDDPTSNIKLKPKKEWNPATFYIVIFLLIGSNAIQMIALRNDFLNFSRKTEAKISLLKDVLDRVQKGEMVDVEGLLGTGNEEQEKEWEEVLREIEEEEQLWKLREKPRSKEWRTKKKDATSDNNESPTDETTRSSKDSTTRRTTNKPPIKLVTASDQARNIDGGPTIPAVMREDDSAIEETRRKSPKFF